MNQRTCKILMVVLVLAAIGFVIYCNSKCKDKSTNVTMRSPIVSPYTSRASSNGSDCPGCREAGGTKYTRREGFLDQYSMNVPVSSPQGIVSAGNEPVTSPFYGSSAPIDGGVWQGVNE